MTCGILGFTPHLSLCPFFGSLSRPRCGSPPRSRGGSRVAPLPCGPPVLPLRLWGLLLARWGCARGLLWPLAFAAPVLTSGQAPWRLIALARVVPGISALGL